MKTVIIVHQEIKFVKTHSSSSSALSHRSTVRMVNAESVHSDALAPPLWKVPDKALSRGCPMQPQKHGRSCRTSSTLQHHSSGGAPATVTCSYILGSHRWTLGWGNLVHDTKTTMPGPCSEKSASPREGRGH
jgi:hypothetical protein